MMFKTLLFTALLLASFTSSAQEWFPLGATWYYHQVEFAVPEPNTFRDFEVIGEAKINGKTCKLVRGTCQCSDYGDLNYLYEEDDKIFRYNQIQDKFTILYNFTMEVGDSLKVNLDGSDPGVYLLDSITTLVLNGIPIRVQHFTVIEWNVTIGLETYEFIGSNYCLYPQYGACDPQTGGLRCYEDPLFGLQKFNGFTLECDTIISSSTTPESESVNIYPNPTNDFITIQATDEIRSAEILDLYSGNPLIKLFRNDTPTFPVSHLAPGTYIVRVSFENQKILFRKIVITN